MYSIFNLHLYLLLSLVICTLLGDYLVSTTKVHLLRAVYDNTTHALIGALSWGIVCLNDRNHSMNHLLEIAISAGISSVIDLDHFITAKSFFLKDATNLPKRPFLHCSTFPLIGSLFLLLLGLYFHWDTTRRLALITFTAFFTHHTRDAARRGYWCYPFGSTPAVPYYLYIFIISCTPYFISKLDVITVIHRRIYTKMEVIV